MTVYKTELRTEKVPTKVTRCIMKTVTEPVEYTVCKMEMRTEKVPVKVTKCIIKTVSEPVEYTVLVPKMVTVKQTVNYCVAVPRTVERDVVTCHYVPVTCVDPCSGCCYTSCQAQTVVKRVSCTVYENKMMSKDVHVQVCQYEKQTRKGTVTRCVPEYVTENVTVERCYCVPVQHTVKSTVTRCVPEYVTENVTVERCYCVSVPTQVTVRVPVCVGYSSPASCEGSGVVMPHAH